MAGTSIGVGSMYATGRMVKGYCVLGKLGQGGMGAVYEVKKMNTNDTNDTYALKTLFDQFIDQPGYKERFEREARILAELTHPNIVQILDYNVNVDGVPFLVMERLVGIDLTERIKQAGFLTFRESLEILTPVTSALELAHNRPEPIVHRDLKPDNIFLCNDEDETVKLLDFGIAKRLRDEGDVATVLTMDGSTMGTTHYMSPEQARGEVRKIDQRTDIFALGAILYQMLSGRYAFDGQGVGAVLSNVMYKNPIPLAQLVENVPAGIQEVIDRMLAKNKLDRYPTVTGFLADLKRINQGMRPAPSSRNIQPAPQIESNDGYTQVTLDSLSASSPASETHLPPMHRKSHAGLFFILGTLAVGGGATASYFTNTPPQFRRFVDKNIKKLRSKMKRPSKVALDPKPMKAEPKKRPRPKARRKRSTRRRYYRRGSRRR